MSKNITIIPPSEGSPDTLRVAAYCRVSTDMEEQASSYASQIRSYTELISQHESWELVDIYADEAVSGTKTEKIDMFLAQLTGCGGLVTEFDEELWYSTVDFVTVYEDMRLVFAFRDGQEIEIPAEIWKAA